MYCLSFDHSFLQEDNGWIWMNNGWMRVEDEEEEEEDLDEVIAESLVANPGNSFQVFEKLPSLM